MNAIDILDFAPINETESEKVEKIKKSILENGWNGMPILTYGNTLITGSHRLNALKDIYDDYMSEYCENDELEKILRNDEIAIDVTDIVEGWMEKNPEEEIPTDCLSILFEGTWVEDYKEELEW